MPVVRSTGPILATRGAVSVGRGWGTRGKRTAAPDRGEKRREGGYSPDDTIDTVEASRARCDTDGLSSDREAISERDCVRELGTCVRVGQRACGREDGVSEIFVS